LIVFCQKLSKKRGGGGANSQGKGGPNGIWGGGNPGDLPKTKTPSGGGGGGGGAGRDKKPRAPAGEGGFLLKGGPGGKGLAAGGPGRPFLWVGFFSLNFLGLVSGGGGGGGKPRCQKKKTQGSGWPGPQGRGAQKKKGGQYKKGLNTFSLSFFCPFFPFFLFFSGLFWVGLEEGG